MEAVAIGLQDVTVVYHSGLGQVPKISSGMMLAVISSAGVCSSGMKDWYVN